MIKLTNMFIALVIGTQIAGCSEEKFSIFYYSHIPGLVDCVSRYGRNDQQCEATILKRQAELAGFIRDDSLATQAQKEACQIDTNVVSEKFLQKIDNYNQHCSAAFDRKNVYFLILEGLNRAAHNHMKPL